MTVIDKRFCNQENSVLKNNLIIMLLGRAVSGISMIAYLFALSLYVIDITSSVELFSRVISISIVPTIIINMLGGVWIDRCNKKKIIVLMDLLTGVLMLYTAITFQQWKESINLLILWVVLIKTLQSIFALALDSSIPQIVGYALTAKANALMQATISLNNIIGALIGGILYSSVGFRGTIILAAISFVCSGITEIYLRFQIEDQESSPYKQTYKGVMNYIKSQKIIWFILFLGAMITFITVPLINVVLPYMSYNILGFSEIQVSSLQVCLGIGTIIGALVIGKGKFSNTTILNKFPMVLWGQAFSIGMWIIPYWCRDIVTTNWILVAIYGTILILWGFISIMQIVPLITYIQTNTPVEMRGSILGVFNMAVTLLTPLGVEAVGSMMKGIGIEGIILCCTLWLMLCTLFVFKNHSYKRLKESYGSEI